MDNSQNSYKQILKATSLFGGVQIFGVLVSIAKSKFAAIFLGPAGVGVLGILNATLNVIVGFFKFGLDISAVKEISALHGESELPKVTRKIDVLRRLTWLTGLLGAVVTIIFSSWLSEIAFGNSDHTISFILISTAIFFNQLTLGNYAILQGLRKLRSLAKATVWASFCSLLVIIPLYYYYGVSGIVAVIVLNAIFTFIFSWYFTKPYKGKPQNLSFQNVLKEGKQMMKLGFVLSLGNLATLLMVYTVQVFIITHGGLEEVGYYNAAFIIINAYVGVIFNAMSKDYFPRLASAEAQGNVFKSIVNHQAFVAILLLTPIIIVFLAFAPLIIRILFSNKFLPILGILTFGMLATLFKAVSWTMGFILIAKGNSKLYIKTEVGFNILLILMSVFGYMLGGLTGVGVGYLLYYLIYLVGMKIITKQSYNFEFNSEFYKVFLICVFFCLGAFIITYIESTYIRYTLLIVIIISSGIFTIFKLDEKTNLIRVIKEKFNNMNNKS